MLNDSRNLTEGLIIFSVLISDFEKLDFKNDALAGVRANYFNSNNSTQQDKTEVSIDDKDYSLSYFMSKDDALSWKIARNNRPYQTVKKATGGIYCVIFYSENGIIYKRQYFNKEHIWIRTEYYDSNYENKLLAVVSQKNICGIVSLHFEKIHSDGKRDISYLFPSQEKPDKKCTAIIYSNAGMLWYDVCFKPEDLTEYEQDDENKSGFVFNLDSFSGKRNNNNTIDLTKADYLEDTDIKEDATPKISESDNSDNSKSYSAYDKIERILSEAHKTNKDLFGEIINQTSDDFISEEDNSDESTDSGNLTNKYDCQDLSPENNSLNNNSGDFSENSNELEFEQCENSPCNIVIHTKSGRYSYYGEVDENNCRTGRGRTVTPEGLTSYDGNYKNDKRNGFGVCYYKEGVINYVGNWENNSRCGSGVGYRLSDGTMHAGKWNDNAPEGVGARFDSDGNFIDVCSYINGVRNGKSISFDENGNVVITKWENGEIISERIISDED